MTTTARPEALQKFLDAVRLGFEAAPADERTRTCLHRVFDRLMTPAPAQASPPAQVPATIFLDAAIEPARRANGAVSTLASSLKAINPSLAWRSRGGTEAEADLSAPGSIANAMIVGPNGLEDRRDVWVGLSLVPPGVRYPDHRHSPEEIYLFLTDGRFKHGESGWFTPGIGGTLYNEPNILHGMEAPAAAPLLAVWCLFDERHQ